MSDIYDHDAEQAKELGKLDAIPEFLALLDDERRGEIRELRARADVLEKMSPQDYAHRGLVVDPDLLVRSAAARACWSALDRATGAHADKDGLTIRYFPSKQAWAWQVHRGSWEWYIATDDLVAAFAATRTP